MSLNSPFHAAVEILTCRMLLNLCRATNTNPPDEDTELSALSGTSSSFDYHRPIRRGIQTDEEWRVAPGLVSSSLGTTTVTGTMSETMESGAPLRREMQPLVAGPSGWGREEAQVKVEIEVGRGINLVDRDLEVDSPVEVEDKVAKKVRGCTLF